jgi:hypothetical protein
MLLMIMIYVLLQFNKYRFDLSANNCMQLLNAYVWFESFTIKSFNFFIKFISARDWLLNKVVEEIFYQVFLSAFFV